MCRLTTYLGPEIALERIIVTPSHSLLEQSQAATEAKLATNGDGFGIAWYNDDPIPGLYRDVLPAWSDGNLPNLFRMVKSHLFLAHVRASTVGEVTRVNCHPFTSRHWSFAHNGQIAEFVKISRALETIRDAQPTTNKPNRLACVLTDGTSVYGFRHSSDHANPTLYLSGPLASGGTALASEPLDDDSTYWTSLQENELICLSKNGVTRHTLH